MENNNNIQALHRPIQPHEIEWRVQSSRNNKTTIVPYITSRAVMTRFDEAFGAMYWKDEYREYKGKGVLCTLSVYCLDKGEWIAKQDGADDTAIEPTKGGISDAIKRAAVKWGLGRDLYQYPLVQIEGEVRYIPNQVKTRLHGMTNAINEGSFKDDYVLIKMK